MAEALVDRQLDALDAAADAKLDAPAEEALELNGDAVAPSGPPRRKNLYFVRVPRPQVDEAPVKELQTKLTAVLTKLKDYNAKLAAKREVVAGLRQQVGVARSLKEEAAPEWQDKITKLNELRDIRKSYLDEIAAVKGSQSGLEARSEAELDAKLAAMEAEISHGQMALREEKQMVKDISRLKSQRDRVREAEGRQASLAQLEGELSKVKATIKELEPEVTSLRGERTQAVGILQEIQEKLREVTGGISELEAERGEVEAKKKALQEQIRAVQDESSELMQEWRENRKFSLSVRDLVEAGKLDEARAMCDEQVATYMGRLLNDKAYRKEYEQGWSEQRKYVVSELLPGSGAAQDVGRGGAGAGARDKGAKGAADAKPRGEPKVEGAAKAAALIEQLMQRAQATVAAQRVNMPQPAHESSEEEPEEAAAGPDANGGGADANGGAPRAAAPRVVPGATEDLLAVKKAKSKPAAAAAAVKRVEVPQVPEIQFEVPAVVVAKEEPAEAAGDLTEEQKKELIREENRRKAAEAAERKKRREEATQRKKQAAEARKAEEPAAPPPPAAAAAPAPRFADDDAAADAEGEAAAPRPQPQKQQKVQQRKPKGAAVIKPEPAAPLKRPRADDAPWRKALKALHLDSSTNQAVAMCAGIMLLIFIVLMMR
ncbi:MAG: hypothetical protein J3K34DRAFT_516093 [Monoraphidium minutum]|nr:MAG: hypothetical protein J3K34DRAFT_516093 [Monoraphidium minutum]